LVLFLRFVFALPQRDKLGRRVIFYRPKAYNPSKCVNHDIIRCNGVVFETLLEDEENQIRGCVHVVDASGLGLSYVTVMTPQETYRITKNCEVRSTIIQYNFNFKVYFPTENGANASQGISRDSYPSINEVRLRIQPVLDE
jgi:CRAL/TRIO domain